MSKVYYPGKSNVTKDMVSNHDLVIILYDYIGHSTTNAIDANLNASQQKIYAHGSNIDKIMQQIDSQIKKPC